MIDNICLSIVRLERKEEMSESRANQPMNNDSERKAFKKCSKFKEATENKSFMASHPAESLINPSLHDT